MASSKPYQLPEYIRVHYPQEATDHTSSPFKQGSTSIRSSEALARGSSVPSCASNVSWPNGFYGRFSTNPRVETLPRCRLLLELFDEYENQEEYEEGGYEYEEEEGGNKYKKEEVGDEYEEEEGGDEYEEDDHEVAGSMIPETKHCQESHSAEDPVANPVPVSIAPIITTNGLSDLQAMYKLQVTAALHKLTSTILETSAYVDSVITNMAMLREVTNDTLRLQSVHGANYATEDAQMKMRILNDKVQSDVLSIQRGFLDIKVQLSIFRDIASRLQLSPDVCQNQAPFQQNNRGIYLNYHNRAMDESITPAPILDCLQDKISEVQARFGDVMLQPPKPEWPGGCSSAEVSVAGRSVLASPKGKGVSAATAANVGSCGMNAAAPAFIPQSGKVPMQVMPACDFNGTAGPGVQPYGYGVFSVQPDSHSFY